MLLASCSWLVTRSVPPSYDGTYEPPCRENAFAIAVDIADIVIDAVVVAVVASTSNGNAPLYAGAGIFAGLSTLSALSGAGRNAECRQAWLRYRGGDTIYDATSASDREQRARDERERLLRAHPELAGVDAGVAEQPSHADAAIDAAVDGDE